ncbi:MAG: phosphotransferase family protein [Actinomycetota bacterium]|nr:phosphotransferase family protein [Actinomycetota bacterium]
MENVGLERLSGALTNVSYKVTTEAGAYVLRLAGEGTSDYVNRTAEGHNARVAAAAGVNAEVLYFDAREGTMLTRFVEGVGMDGNDFSSDPWAPSRAALALKRVHGTGRVFKSRFNAFAMIDGYVELLHRLRMPLPEDYYEVGREAEAVRRVLEASPMPLAPCHNDPWPGNFLDTGTNIYIIDWEYSGMNDPMWDLSDLSVEAGFGPQQDQAMMETYYGCPAPAALYSRLALYKTMSDLHWSLWAMVQHANGNPADDFRTYATTRLERCKARMGGADFGRDLATVGTAAVSSRPCAFSSKRAYRSDSEHRNTLHSASGNGLCHEPSIAALRRRYGGGVRCAVRAYDAEEV